MKYSYLWLIALSVILSSCGNTIQEYRFNEDGSVYISTRSDKDDPNTKKGVLNITKNVFKGIEEDIDTFLSLEEFSKSKIEMSNSAMNSLKNSGLTLKVSNDGINENDYYDFMLSFDNEDDKETVISHVKNILMNDNIKDSKGMAEMIDIAFAYSHDPIAGTLLFDNNSLPIELTGGMDMKMMASFLPEEELNKMKAEIPGNFKRIISIPGSIISISNPAATRLNDSTVVLKTSFVDIMFEGGIPAIEIIYDPASKITDPKVTEVWDPEPEVVDPGKKDDTPPSDALVLFNGKNADQWQHLDGSSVQWDIDKKCMIVKPGAGGIQTKESFGDCQLHIEWQSPKGENAEGQGRGNSGVFFHGGKYEIQILNSYQNRTYANGQAASIYKQNPPLVNAMRPPGEWNTYDIIFHSPIFDKQGKKIKNATMTAFHNGILVQDHFELKGTTEYIGRPKNFPHGEGPIMLQDHSNKVSFRNIWLRRI